MFKVKSGEIDKLGLLYERYKKMLFAYFFRSTNDRYTSEDLVQIVFTKILTYRHNFSGTGKFTTWMYRIAYNVSIDHFRKNQRYQMHGELNEMSAVDEQTPEIATLQNEQIQLLHKALAALSHENRTVLLLSKFQKLKYKEIGHILDCSENTVKVKVFRALSDLKKNYNLLEKS
ncbi:MAG: sigma-70 family RNA polymerase sigma factor [Calditrichaeota bacterium]|nr:MAG: sigma-70 family RNA polymerase sigma factor [Calditrichota bacterium]